MFKKWDKEQHYFSEVTVITTINRSSPKCSAIKIKPVFMAKNA